MNQNQSIDLALCDQPCRHGRFPKSRWGAENSLVVDADPCNGFLLDGPKQTIEFHCDGCACESLVPNFGPDVVRLQKGDYLRQKPAWYGNVLGKILAARD